MFVLVWNITLIMPLGSYVIGKVIGKGSYGQVSLARHKKDKKQVYCKSKKHLPFHSFGDFTILLWRIVLAREITVEYPPYLFQGKGNIQSNSFRIIVFIAITNYDIVTSASSYSNKDVFCQPENVNFLWAFISFAVCDKKDRFAWSIR